MKGQKHSKSFCPFIKAIIYSLHMIVTKLKATSIEHYAKGLVTDIFIIFHNFIKTIDKQLIIFDNETISNKFER